MEKEQRVQPALPSWWWLPRESAASKGGGDGFQGRWGWLPKAVGMVARGGAAGAAAGPGERRGHQPWLAGDREACATKGKCPAQAGKSPAEITAGMGCAAGVPCMLRCICSFPPLPPRSLPLPRVGERAQPPRSSSCRAAPQGCAGCALRCGAFTVLGPGSWVGGYRRRHLAFSKGLRGHEELYMERERI